jgi:transcriptional regulator with XRE-family HTH domain
MFRIRKLGLPEMAKVTGNAKNVAISDESVNPAASVGVSIRRLRQSRGWTLSELARRSGVPLSTLSKIENQQVGASYCKISSIAEAFGTKFDHMFGPALPSRGVTGRRSITRAGQGKTFANDYYDYEVHSSDLASKAMVPLFMTIRNTHAPEAHMWSSHEGEELVVVLTGTIIFYTEFYEPETLAVGDTAYIDSRMKHAFSSVGTQPAKIMSLCYAPSGHSL